MKLAEVQCQLGHPEAEGLLRQHLATLRSGADKADSLQVAEASIALSAAVASRRAHREAEGIASAALTTLKKVRRPASSCCGGNQRRRRAGPSLDDWSR